jgi:LysM repeat protein
MRRQPTSKTNHFTSSVFDVHADEAADITQQFWGSAPGWVARSIPAAPPVDEAWGDDHPTTAIRTLKSGLAAFRPQRIARPAHTADIERTRQHGVVRSRQPQQPKREPTIGELASAALHNEWENEWEPDARETDQPDQYIELSQVAPLANRLGIGAVDPLLLRLGMMLLIGVLMVPIALSVRTSGRAEGLQTATASIAVASPVPAATVVAASVAPLVPAPVDSTGQTDRSDAVGTAITEPAVAAVTERVAAPTTTKAPAGESLAGASPTAGDIPEAKSSATSAAAVVSAPAERVVPQCPQTYEAGPGDSWYRIAAAASVSPNALMNENLATLDTTIFPGDAICLPVGATMPSKPTTTTAAPIAIVPATSPATTSPATTSPATTTPVAPGTVEQIIREVWPDELEDKALTIAWRESHYIPTAYNGGCCYGLFQIYWSAHRSWLDDYGIYTSSDLFDARKNTQAAYALYQRSGGWSPWGG